MAPDPLPIQTRSLRIRPLIRDDAERVLVLSNEASARAWLPSQVCRDSAHARSMVETLVRHYSDPGDPRHGPYVLAIEARGEGVLIGHVGFSPLDDEVEIGFGIAESQQRRGLASEAIAAASRWALENFSLDRILGVTSAANIASQRTLARAGFVREEDRTMHFQGTEQRVHVYTISAGSIPETNPVKIERLGAAEAERLRSIRLRSLREAPDAFSTTADQAATWPAESWDRQLEELATFVATAGGRDLGIVRGVAHDQLPDVAYLISMWVAPEARRRRVGSALVDAVVDWARRRGFHRVILDVAESNAPAIALYRRRGFAPNGEVGTLPPPREHVREIQMVRTL